MYELNTEAFQKFVDYRRIAFTEKWENSRGNKFPKPLTDYGKTRWVNLLKKVPPNVQEMVVNKSVKEHWEKLYLPKDTLHLDGDNPVAKEKTPIHEDIDRLINNITKKMPAPKTYSEEENKKAAKKALEGIRDMEFMKKGSSLDPFWKGQMEHEEKTKTLKESQNSA